MKPGQIIREFPDKSNRPVVFRYLRRSDVNGLLGYINTLIAEDTFIGLCGKPLTLADETVYVRDSLKDMKNQNRSHIVVTVGGTITGEAELKRDRFPRRKHVGSLGISVLAPYRESGIGSELLKTMIDEAKHMNLEIIELTCFANNQRALHVYEKFGFRRAGVIPKGILYKQQHIDDVILYLPVNERNDYEKTRIV
jgi:RimJ/RimL family protein N-acetyltransferase